VPTDDEDELLDAVDDDEVEAGVKFPPFAMLVLTENPVYGGVAEPVMNCALALETVAKRLLLCCDGLRLAVCCCCCATAAATK